MNKEPTMEEVIRRIREAAADEDQGRAPESPRQENLSRNPDAARSVMPARGQ